MNQTIKKFDYVHDKTFKWWWWNNPSMLWLETQMYYIVLKILMAWIYQFHKIWLKIVYFH